MKHRSGFTIVEIIVVIAVIGILMTIGVVSYSGMQTRARDTDRVADIDSMAAALESYYERLGKYPDQATWQDAAFISDTLQLREPALRAPSDSTSGSPLYSFGWRTSVTTAQYGYQAYQSTGTACTTAAQTCTRFTLYYNLERSGNQTRLSKFGN